MAIFTGTTGDDSIQGTSAGDDFHLEQGGQDTASGGAGVDIFYMGASLDAGDQLDGGGGADFLNLDGDYSGGVVLTATTVRGVERFVFTAGHDYVLSGLSDANLSDQLLIDASNLGADDGLSFDASLVTHSITMTGGAGADRLIAGSGADTLTAGLGRDTLGGGDGADQFYLGANGQTARGGNGDDIFNAAANGFGGKDKLDGGAGFDRLMLVNVTGTIVLHDASVTNFEYIELNNQVSATLVMADGNVAAGQNLSIRADTGGVDFDGSLETDGSFSVIGSAYQSDTLTGGAGADFLFAASFDNSHPDTVIGGAGRDTLSASLGDDKFVGGAGADEIWSDKGADRFFYLDASDSTPEESDLIKGFDRTDTLYLQPVDADIKRAGNQAFHLVDAFTGHRGELTVSFDSTRHVTNVSGDVDGDGQADLLIQISGDRTDHINFVL